MDSFTDLKAWQKGMLLVREIYTMTSSFPATEKFEMVSQLKRASTSILANIAEAHGRFTFQDKAHKFTIARGECAEVVAFLHIATELSFIRNAESKPMIDLAEEVGRILSGLIKPFQF